MAAAKPNDASKNAASASPVLYTTGHGSRDEPKHVWPGAYTVYAAARSIVEHRVVPAAAASPSR